MEIKAGDFSSREELDNHVSTITGATTERKELHKITGSPAELRRLNLSPNKTVWGVPVVASTTPSPKDSPPSKQKEKVARGKIHIEKKPEVDIKNSLER